MARSPRLDRPGAWHHVMHRGARREAIFRKDDHCLLFLASLQEAVEHHGLEVHAYSLMPNHYHLLARTRLGNLSRCMRHVNSTYTQRVNARYGWDGPLFRGRFRSQLVDDEAYLDHLFAYVHLNPFRAGLARRLDEPNWTSLRAYLGKERPPVWLSTEFFTARFGGRVGVEEAIRQRRKRPDGWPADLDRETGWIMAVATDEAPGPRSQQRAVERRASAERVLRQVAQHVGCSVANLRRQEMGRGSNPARRFAVWVLSRSQVYSHREIAGALEMSERQVTQVLWRLRSGDPGPPVSEWIKMCPEWMEAGK